MPSFPHASVLERTTDAAGRTVARKTLGAGLSARPAMRARWAAASPALAALDVPGSVHLLEHGERDGRLTVTLEWLDGAEDLRTRIHRDGPMSLTATAALLGPPAGALDDLHRAGITYADAKTGNVLVLPGGRSRLAHAWLSFPHGDPDPSRFLEPGAFAGTIDYAAPEVIEGALPSLASDVYGLACAAFECLTGRTPFARDTEDATLEAHLEDPPPRTGDPAADAVLRRGLAKDPGERFARAADLVAALGRAARA